MACLSLVAPRRAAAGAARCHRGGGLPDAVRALGQLAGRRPTATARRGGPARAPGGGRGQYCDSILSTTVMLSDSLYTIERSEA